MRAAAEVAAIRYAVAEFWRLWVAGKVANAMVLVQLKGGEWRVLADVHDPNAKPRHRLPPGAGRLRDLEGNPSASRPSRQPVGKLPIAE